MKAAMLLATLKTVLEPMKEMWQETYQELSTFSDLCHIYYLVPLLVYIISFLNTPWSTFLSYGAIFAVYGSTLAQGYYTTKELYIASNADDDFILERIYESHTMPEVQFMLQCCGAFNYTDYSGLESGDKANLLDGLGYFIPPFCFRNQRTSWRNLYMTGCIEAMKIRLMTTYSVFTYILFILILIEIWMIAFHGKIMAHIVNKESSSRNNPKLHRKFFKPEYKYTTPTTK